MAADVAIKKKNLKETKREGEREREREGVGEERKGRGREGKGEGGVKGVGFFWGGCGV